MEPLQRPVSVVPRFPTCPLLLIPISTPPPVETWQVITSLGLCFVICEMGLIIDLWWCLKTLLHTKPSALCLAPITAQSM